MELRNGQITLGELWKNQQARKLLIAQIPVLKRGLPLPYYNVTLSRAMSEAKKMLPQNKINMIYDDLSRL